ncbi:4-hydroxy-tetrahydrodipicolinate reductase [Candidatus Xenohaliotis californiensis]|uniref:4-hydroxy-tetrahydrodipicolinate reductase n=1 Tax=Candidatus Xenohaliotis californiensis TaxID=84677 RepID=A0ABM9N880_9RICK|nr:4-hydroxy-tetrahydrodipicolinate reductase [Candidatus Xenohaliotis californiensis]
MKSSINKSIGIIGITGRMGKALSATISNHKDYEVGLSYSHSQNPFVALSDVFQKNSYIIDFSSSKFTKEILYVANQNPKPLIICTTGWSMQNIKEDLICLKQKVPVVIAENTSIGACIQRYFTGLLAKILKNNYDISILEKHHRNKVDCPSGTALSLVQKIQSVQKRNNIKPAEPHFFIKEGSRPDNIISMSVERSGNLSGEHNINFTNSKEMIAIKHIAFNHILFAEGALKIVEWLDAIYPSSGIYTMTDVLGLRNIDLSD